MAYPHCLKVLKSAALGAALAAGMWIAPSSNVHAGEPTKGPVLDLYDEVVCRVNTEALSKRDVELRMGDVANTLYGRRRQMENAGQWSPEFEKQWNQLYIPPFRDALRKLVRERLMIQQAGVEKITVDERQVRKRVDETIKRLKESGAGSVFSLGEIQRRVRENMLLDNFRGKFYNQLEMPSRPEVTRYYTENISKYQRKSGVKIRLIRIDRFITDPYTQKTTAREKAWEQADELRRDIVEYGADFAEVAKIHTDDILARERGGLVVIDSKDPYLDPDSYNPTLANNIRGLKPGEVSKVFEFGQTSWAFAMVEDRREAGAAPLEGALYDEIYKFLMDNKSAKREDEWFRKTLQKSLVTHVVEGVSKTLPLEFFFPDEKDQTADARQKSEKKPN